MGVGNTILALKLTGTAALLPLEPSEEVKKDSSSCVGPLEKLIQQRC